MDKKYTFFISSTHSDLIAERKSIANYVLEIDEIPIGMEQFGAVSVKVWLHITRLIDTSDYFILLIAGRYGSIDPSDPEGLSYTHKEFRHARDHDIPVICILHKDLGKLPRDKSETDPERIKKLEAFREEAMNGRLVEFFSDEHECLRKAAAGITKQKAMFPRPGWVRSTEQRERLAYEVQISAQRAQNENLIVENSHLKSSNLDLKERYENKVSTKGLDVPTILYESFLLGSADLHIQYYSGLEEREYVTAVSLRSAFRMVAGIIRGSLDKRIKFDEAFVRAFAFKALNEDGHTLPYSYDSLKILHGGLEQMLEHFVESEIILREDDNYSLTTRGLRVYVEDKYFPVYY